MQLFLGVAGRAEGVKAQSRGAVKALRLAEVPLLSPEEVHASQLGVQRRCI